MGEMKNITDNQNDSVLEKLEELGYEVTDEQKDKIVDILDPLKSDEVILKEAIEIVGE
ncbi:hypothetical protein [Clostridium botulinum]|uniref:hypothetical protein n=1 Tax=Clostridium botulinum TaxID=1491 RepID=UPI000AD9AC0E|nr:hypothetical protein [Clostridium botulinum]MBY6934512.1 hypothetical protein [Clostridium botulinum]